MKKDNKINNPENPQNSKTVNSQMLSIQMSLHIILSKNTCAIITPKRFELIST